LTFSKKSLEDTPSVDERMEAFDMLLPEPPTRLDITPKRLTFKRPSGPVVICLLRPNRYHEAILIALSDAVQSSWFQGLTSTTQLNHLLQIQDLFEWINESKDSATETNCYGVLKDYEAHRLNKKGIKHSPLRYLRPLLGNGLDAKGLADEDYLYLRSLFRLSPPCKPSEPEPYTLGDWFSLPWLRFLIGEREYLSLESPSRLLRSFRVTTATTLTYLLTIRDEWTKRPNVSWNADLRNNTKHWHSSWNSQALKQLATFDSSCEPANELTHLLCLDMASSNQRPKLKRLIVEQLMKGISSRPSPKVRFRHWRLPVFFHPDNEHSYSKVEELLMAWLVACETVQPADIAKLKTTDYACEHNASGRLIAMQCCYYKGRSKNHKEPAMLLASDPWTKAQYAYLKGLPISSKLFRFNVGRASSVPHFVSDAKDVNTPMSFVWKLWQTPHLQNQIRAALKRANAEPIFLEAALALTQGSENFSSFSWKNPSALIANYKAAVPRPLPLVLFSLAHIKTTAVHAGSDSYRDGDLINHHSHTSTTEKHHYLTDKNKDFVNRAGRITRLVLHDLQNVVYQPSVNALRQAVNDLELRSQVIDATGIENANVQLINAQKDEIRSDTNELILIPDTIEQALIFTHSIAQAEDRYQQLLSFRPDWVERTLLPQLEWMTRVLAKMRSAAAAQQQYLDLKNHLPPIFDHLLETHE